MRRLLIAAIPAFCLHGWLLWMDPFWEPFTSQIRSANMPVSIDLTYLPPPAASSVPLIASDPVTQPEPERRPSAPALPREKIPSVKKKIKRKPQQQPARVISSPASKPHEKPLPKSDPPKKTVKPPATEVKHPGAKLSERPAPKRNARSHSASKKPTTPTPLIEAIPIYRRNPSPRYPRLARKRKYQGTVILDVLVLPDGSVGDLKVHDSSGYSILDKAALKSVNEWLFEPGRRGEEKIEMWVRVPVRFKLQ